MKLGELRTLVPSIINIRDRSNNNFLYREVCRTGGVFYNLSQKEVTSISVHIGIVLVEVK